MMSNEGFCAELNETITGSLKYQVTPFIWILVWVTLLNC